jgi:MFS transporter, DHA2 family, multidrug resistance protein
VVQNWMTSTSNIVSARGGYSIVKSHQVATKLLAEVGGREAATLAYADAFLFMALIGVITLCIVPIIPPTPPAVKK